MSDSVITPQPARANAGAGSGYLLTSSGLRVRHLPPHACPHALADALLSLPPDLRYGLTPDAAARLAADALGTGTGAWGEWMLTDAPEGYDLGLYAAAERRRW